VTGAEELFAAIDRGEAERVRELVRSDPSLAAARDEDGVSAVLRARYRGLGEAVEALLEAGPELDVFDAAALGELERLRELLDRDASETSAYSSDGFTPLHLASFFGQPGAVELLLERGADVSAVSRNPLGVTPLHSAAAARQTRIADLLLERGADAGARQQGGFTALHAAAQNGDGELAELLLACGADRGARSEDGRLPAELAAEQGHAELAGRLEPV
jgi:uncharacterized protein